MVKYIRPTPWGVHKVLWDRGPMRVGKGHLWWAGRKGRAGGSGYCGCLREGGVCGQDDWLLRDQWQWCGCCLRAHFLTQHPEPPILWLSLTEYACHPTNCAGIVSLTAALCATPFILHAWSHPQCVTRCYVGSATHPERKWCGCGMVALALTVIQFI